MRKHLILLCTAAFLSSLHITAQSFRNEIDAKPKLSASNCLALSRPGATLRFGHETMVMPLACLLNLNGSYVQVAQVDSLEAHGWIASRIFPMAANIQLVFYKNPKNPKADLLVKALLNEEEATMPLPATSTPYYYKWSDFRKFYLDLLNSYREQ